MTLPPVEPSSARASGATGDPSFNHLPPDPPHSCHTGESDPVPWTGLIPPTDTRPLRGAPVAVLDFESTGLDPTTARACSVAVVYIPALGESEPVPMLYTTLNPQIPIPVEASKIHGIYDKDVVDAPTFAEVADVVVSAIDGCVLCAYNLPYETLMLRAELGRAGHRMPVPFGTLDPLILARHVFRYVGPKYKKLVNIAQHYGIELEAHNALSDAMATALILPKLLRDVGRGIAGDPRPGRLCPKEALMSVEGHWRWLSKVGIEGEVAFRETLRRFKDPGPAYWWELTREAEG